jgi:hypothetical protein
MWAWGTRWAKAGAARHNMIGISYLAFRCSRLVLEIRNGVVQKPNLLEYLNFAFFLPTMPVGPINTYANFRRGFGAQPYDVPVGRAALRILVGAVKYEFLANLCNQLTYAGCCGTTIPILDGFAGGDVVLLPVSLLEFLRFLRPGHRRGGNHRHSGAGKF